MLWYDDKIFKNLLYDSIIVLDCFYMFCPTSQTFVVVIHIPNPCFSEVWRGSSGGISLFCSWSSDNIAGGSAAHTYQSLWSEWVRVINRVLLYSTFTKEYSYMYVEHFYFFLSIRRHSFGISFLSRDRNGTEMYLSLASDWDLDVAFVSAAKPYLQLKMDIKSSEESKNISWLPV